jgi:hypothetical protein
LCASPVKLLDDFCYSYTPIPTRLFGEIVGAYVYNALEKIPTNIFMSLPSQGHYVLSVYILMSFDFPFVRLLGVR